MMGGLAIAWLLLSRDNNTLNLRYDQLTKILVSAQNDPSIAFQNVKVGKEDIRGEILVNDPVSDGGDNAKSAQTFAFRTQRRGLEEDRGLHELLKKAAPGYDGEQAESAFKGVWSAIFVLMLLAGGVVAAF